MSKTSKKTKTKKKKTTKSFPRNKKIIPVALVLIFAVLVGIAAHFSGINKNNPISFSSDKDVLCGVDVSSHNGKIDWEKVAGQKDFAIIRVGYRGYGNGEIYIDKKAKRNLKEANEAGIPVGVYFYSQAITPQEAEEEADFVLKIIKKYNITLPVFYDFEYAESNGKKTGRLFQADLSPSDNTKLVNSFCSTVEDAGYNSGVYASSYIYRGHFKMKKISKSICIWVADYNEKVTYSGDYDLWQYSDKGTCSGIKSKNVDLDYFYVKNK